MSTEKTSITLPEALAKKLRKLAKSEHRSLSGVLQEAARYYLRSRQWETLQEQFSFAAARADIHSEDDVGALITKYRSDQ
jgi:metal-responsive CopG/Arc/MetJ family transcriptional regulator